MDSPRETILKTALFLFAAKGYHAVGVQDLCVSSGITKPTLYYHFGSKRALLEAIGKEYYAPFVSGISRACAYRHDVAASLVAVMEWVLQSARSEADFTRLRISTAFCPPVSEEYSVFSPYRQETSAILQSFFTEASRDHGNMKGGEVAYTASFLGTADAYAGLLIAGSLDPDEQFVRRVVHHFMHGIFS